MAHQEPTLIKVLFGNALTCSDSPNFNVINDCFGSNTETKIRFFGYYFGTQCFNSTIFSHSLQVSLSIP